MKLLAVLLLSIALHAESRLYRWSVAALATGAALDCASSYGAVELNPLLRSEGRFQAKGIAIRAVVIGGGLGVQWLIRRRHPEVAKSMAVGNFAMGAGLSGIAGRNWRVRE